MIIASNFKANHTRKSTNRFINEIKTLMKDKKIKDDIYIFVPSSCLDSFELPYNFKIGAQNGYPANCGPFTGEITKEQLDEFDIKTILIGHSERRHILKESNELIEQKYNFYKELGYDIIFCIGEPLEVREKGIDEVISYNLSQLKNIDIDYEKLTIAYEPIWAIGTGISASFEQIDETHNILRQSIKAPLLYGGSVKVENLQQILSIQNVDGVLVGTASWKVEDFKKMIMISKEMN